MSGHSGEIALTTDGSGDSPCVLCWETTSWMQLRAYKQGMCPRRCLTVLGNSYVFAAQANKPLIHVWDISKEQMHCKLTCPANVSALATSPDGLYCAAASSETIYIWQISTGDLLSTLSRHFQPITCLSFTDDCSYLISGADDNLVFVWSLVRVISPSTGLDLGCCNPKYTWSNHSLPITHVHVGRGGKYANVVTASLDHTCKLWNLSNGNLLRSFVFNVAISSTILDAAEYRLFAGGLDGKIYVVHLFSQISTGSDLDEDNQAVSFVGHSMQVVSLSLSMDGLTLLSGSKDSTARVWDVSSRQCLRVLKHKGSVENVQILPRPQNFDVKPTKTSLPVLAAFKRTLQDLSLPQHGIPVRLMTCEDQSRRQKHQVDSLFHNMLDENCENEEADWGRKRLSYSELNEQLETTKKLNRSLYKFAVDDLLSGIREPTEHP